MVELTSVSGHETTLSLIKSAKKKMPRRTVIYGPHGVGKSTWACKWPSPIVISTEDGISDIDVPAFPLATNAGTVWRYCVDLAEGGHEYKTLIIDSIDWLEKIMIEEICEAHGKKSLQDFDFGKGTGLLTQAFGRFLTNFAACRAIGMHIVVVSHSKVRKEVTKDGEILERMNLKLQDSLSALLQEWSDELLYADYEMFTREIDSGFGKLRTLTVGGDGRLLYTQQRGGYTAKNRLNLPPEISLDSFDEYLAFLQ